MGFTKSVSKFWQRRSDFGALPSTVLWTPCTSSSSLLRSIAPKIILQVAFLYFWCVLLITIGCRNSKTCYQHILAHLCKALWLFQNSSCSEAFPFGHKSSLCNCAIRRRTFEWRKWLITMNFLSEKTHGPQCHSLNSVFYNSLRKTSL